MGPVLIIVPVLRRPHRVAPLLASIEAATPEPHRVLFVGSPGDTAEHAAVRAAGADLLILDQEVGPGDYARKLNAAYRASDEPLLLCGADDLHFHPGWLPAATARLEGRIQVVGTNDLGNPKVLKGQHSTHPLVTRHYCDTQGTVDGPGQVYCEDYPHEWCDDEFVQTAMRRRAWAFAGDSIVEHLHPSWGKAPTDELYDAQRERMAAGRQIYLRRRARWM